MPLVAAAPGVGKNLQDHLSTGWIVHTPTPVTMVDAEKPKQILSYLLRRRGMLTSNVAEAVAMIHTEPGLPGPDIELIFAPVPFLDHGFTEPPGHGFTLGVILLQPASTGTVRLASADPTVPPEIDPNYLDDPDDVRRLVAGSWFAKEMLAQPALGATRRPTDATGRMARRRPCSSSSSCAPTRRRSTTRSAPRGWAADPGSVVDEELRVRGVSRTSGSSMPR